MSKGIKRIAIKRNFIWYMTLGMFGTVYTYWTESPKVRTIWTCRVDATNNIIEKTTTVNVPDVCYLIAAKKIFWLTLGTYRQCAALLTPVSDQPILNLDSWVFRPSFGSNLISGRICISDKPLFYFFFLRRSFDKFIIDRFWRSVFMYGDGPILSLKVGSPLKKYYNPKNDLISDFAYMAIGVWLVFNLYKFIAATIALMA